MKNLLIALFTLFSLSSFAQYKDTFEFKVIDTVNASKQELYLRARQFVALNFKDSKSVIQMDDKDAGTIICKGVMKIYSKGFLGSTVCSYISFTMTINTKDNKYRCVLNDFSHDGYTNATTSFNPKGGDLENFEPACGNGMYGIPQKMWYRIQDETKKEAEMFLLTVKIEMRKGAKNDDF
jgi:hypothetical protein